MSKQLTLFGTHAPSKTHVIYRYPKGDYECFVERYCLHAKKESTIFNRQKIHGEAQTAWKNLYRSNKEKLQEFLALRKNEDPFVESAGKSIDGNESQLSQEGPWAWIF